MSNDSSTSTRSRRSKWASRLAASAIALSGSAFALGALSTPASAEPGFKTFTSDGDYIYCGYAYGSYGCVFYWVSSGAVVIQWADGTSSVD